MKKCDFRFLGEEEEFVCTLPRGHLTDHRDKKGFAMFNVDIYTVKKRKPGVKETTRQ